MSEATQASSCAPCAAKATSAAPAPPKPVTLPARANTSSSAAGGGCGCSGSSSGSGYIDPGVRMDGSLPPLEELDVGHLRGMSRGTRKYLFDRDPGYTMGLHKIVENDFLKSASVESNSTNAVEQPGCSSCSTSPVNGSLHNEFEGVRHEPDAAAADGTHGETSNASGEGEPSHSTDEDRQPPRSGDDGEEECECSIECADGSFAQISKDPDSGNPVCTLSGVKKVTVAKNGDEKEYLESTSPGKLILRLTGNGSMSVSVRIACRHVFAGAPEFEFSNTPDGPRSTSLNFTATCPSVTVFYIHLGKGATEASECRIDAYMNGAPVCGAVINTKSVKHGAVGEFDDPPPPIPPEDEPEEVECTCEKLSSPRIPWQSSETPIAPAIPDTTYWYVTFGMKGEPDGGVLDAIFTAYIKGYAKQKVGYTIGVDTSSLVPGVATVSSVAGSLVTATPNPTFGNPEYSGEADCPSTVTFTVELNVDALKFAIEMGYSVLHIVVYFTIGNKRCVQNLVVYMCSQEAMLKSLPSELPDVSFGAVSSVKRISQGAIGNSERAELELRSAGYHTIVGFAGNSRGVYGGSEAGWDYCFLALEFEVDVEFGFTFVSPSCCCIYVKSIGVQPEAFLHGPCRTEGAGIDAAKDAINDMIADEDFQSMVTALLHSKIDSALTIAGWDSDRCNSTSTYDTCEQLRDQFDQAIEVELDDAKQGNDGGIGSQIDEILSWFFEAPCTKCSKELANWLEVVLSEYRHRDGSKFCATLQSWRDQCAEKLSGPSMSGILSRCDQEIYRAMEMYCQSEAMKLVVIDTRPHAVINNISTEWSILPPGYTATPGDAPCPCCALVWVHGFLNDSPTALHGFKSLDAMLRALGSKCAVYGLSWQSNTLSTFNVGSILYDITDYLIRLHQFRQQSWGYRSGSPTGDEYIDRLYEKLRWLPVNLDELRKHLSDTNLWPVKLPPNLNAPPKAPMAESLSLFARLDLFAQDIGRRILVNYLLDLRERCPTTVINVGAHSLGNAVLLSALREIVEWNLKDRLRINSAILAAPAVAQFSLQPGGEYRAALKAAQDIEILYNPEDLILKFAYGYSELLAAPDRERRIALGNTGGGMKQGVLLPFSTIEAIHTLWTSLPFWPITNDTIVRNLKDLKDTMLGHSTIYVDRFAQSYWREWAKNREGTSACSSKIASRE